MPERRVEQPGLCGLRQRGGRHEDRQHEKGAPHLSTLAGPNAGVQVPRSGQRSHSSHRAQNCDTKQRTVADGAGWESNALPARGGRRRTAAPVGKRHSSAQGLREPARMPKRPSRLKAHAPADHCRREERTPAAARRACAGEVRLGEGASCCGFRSG
jgi:hypothetical protein